MELFLFLVAFFFLSYDISIPFKVDTLCFGKTHFEIQPMITCLLPYFLNILALFVMYACFDGLYSLHVVLKATEGF